MQHIYEFHLELNKPDIDFSGKSREEIEQIAQEANFRIYRDRFVTDSSRQRKVSRQIIKELQKIKAVLPEDKISNFYLAKLR